MPLKILAIDTVTQASSAALQVGEKIIERHELAPQQQSALILPMVKSLLDEANLKLTDLDAIAFGAGPGSFTGQRLSASIVQGFCFAAALPALPISNLRAIAQSVYREHGARNVFVAQDARQGEIYCGAYTANDKGLMQPLIKDQLTKPEKLPMPTNLAKSNWVGAGDAWQIYAEAFKRQFETLQLKLTALLPEQNAKACDILQLGIDEFLQGNGVPAKQILPIYLAEFKKINK